MRRRLVVGSVSIAFLTVLLSCGTTTEDAGLGAVGTVQEGFRVALLLPDRKAERYERLDRPYLTRAVAARCPRCEIVYRNAEGDHTRQERQMAALLADGVRLFVLDPVVPGAVAGIVAMAKLLGAKVVAYDRLANGPVDAYVTIDDAQLGRALGRALLDAVAGGGATRRGRILMINDASAPEVRRGAHEVLDGRVAIGREIEGTDPGRVAAETRRAIADLGARGIAGVYCANDAMTDAVVAAMAAAGVPQGTPLVGQGAGPAAVRRILTGAQAAAVHRPISAEAVAAARVAVELAAGGTVHGTAMVANGTTASIPALFIPPITVTSATLADPVARRRWLTGVEQGPAAVPGPR